MSVILTCPHSQQPQPFIGVDPTCTKPAIFCVEHSPHITKQGLLHQMMPLGQFRRNLNQQKFKMSDKVAVLAEQYSAFMDELIKEITELKLRKVVELSMLWLRELATTEDQYENLRRIYRNDFEGLTCKDAHNLYFKVVGNVDLQKKKIEEIQCYREICGVMATLQGSVKARIAITQKIMELEGVVQKGELLKRALPDRRVLKQNTKEILLQPKTPNVFQVKYNRVSVRQNSRNFQSIFSKYPLIQHTNYHLLVTTKYTNILVGLCNDSLKKAEEQTDLHYSPHSIAFNCSNGCLYRDGMFESGSSHLTKGQKVLQLILRVTDMEFMILLGKNVVCRTNIQDFKKGKLFLHLLMRTQGDAIQIDRDKFTIPAEERSGEALIQPTKHQVSDVIEQQPSLPSVPSLPSMPSATTSPQISIDKALLVGLNKTPPPPNLVPTRSQRSSAPPIQDILRQNMRKKTSPVPAPIPAPIDTSPMFQSLFQKHPQQSQENSINMIQSSGLKKSMPLGNSLGDKFSKDSKTLKPQQKSKVFIDVQNSMVASQPQEVSSRYASNVYGDLPPPPVVKPQKESLINPAIILPLKKSQFQFSLRSSAVENGLTSHNISPLPSMKMLQKKASQLTNTLNGIRGTQMEDDWI